MQCLWFCEGTIPFSGLHIHKQHWILHFRGKQPNPGRIYHISWACRSCLNLMEMLEGESWEYHKHAIPSMCNCSGAQLQGLSAHFEELCGQQQMSIPICFPHIPSEVLPSHLLVQLLGFRHLLSDSVPLILPQTRTGHDCGSWLPSQRKVKLFQSQMIVQQWSPI